LANVGTPCFQADTDNFTYYEITVQTNGSVKFRRGRPLVANTDITWAGGISTNTWYRFVGTYDGSQMRLYSATIGAGHTLRAGPTASSGYGDSSLDEWSGVGATNDNAGIYQYFDGLVDDVRVYNVALDVNALDDEYDTEACGDEDGLVAYWKLNNGYSDETVGGYDLTATNGPNFSSTVPFSNSENCDVGGGGTGTTTTTVIEGEADVHWGNVLLMIIAVILGLDLIRRTIPHDSR